MNRIACFLLFATLPLLTACSSTYLGRMASMHGPDVEDYRKLPNRSVENLPESAAMPVSKDPNWVRKTPFVYAGQSIDSPEKIDRLLEQNASTAFIVIANGAVVDERYYHGYQRDSLYKSFSISKSVLSAMLGIAQNDGVLSSTDTVSKYVELEAEGELGKVTLEQLLDNISGFKYERGFAPWKQQPRMYYSTDVRNYVLNEVEFAHAPGSKFEGEDLSPLLLGIVLEAALKKQNTDTSLSAFASTRLWQPMGAEYPALWVTDHKDGGMEKTESGFVARAIDLARFGQLYLDNGKAKGVQIVPEQWVLDSVNAPVRGAPNLFKEGYYQNLWWGYFREGRKRNDFYANGHFGQRIYVSPDKSLVIVRMGSDSGEVNWTEFSAAIADVWSSSQ